MIVAMLNAGKFELNKPNMKMANHSSLENNHQVILMQFDE